MIVHEENQVLGATFFARPALYVARDLIGKKLVRKTKGKRISGIITEVEAYIGPQDKACHAYKGLTTRTKVMFGPPGHWYVYFIYGMYWMLNIVTGKEGHPSAVLIRRICKKTTEATEGTQHQDKSGAVQAKATEESVLRGPGILTREFKIDGKFNGKSSCETSGLWIEDRGVEVPRSKIIRTPRIGVAYAEEWANKPYRFLMVQ